MFQSNNFGSEHEWEGYFFPKEIVSSLEIKKN